MVGRGLLSCSIPTSNQISNSPGKLREVGLWDRQSHFRIAGILASLFAYLVHLWGSVMTSFDDQTKSVKLAKDKLLGFRHLQSLDDKGKLAAQAEDLFNKRGNETGTEPSRK